MHERPSEFSINRELCSAHTGLIIGCGHDGPSRSKHLSHDELHPASQYYTVDLLSKINPDIVGDICNPFIQQYLCQQKFNLICIECVPALFFGGENRMLQLIKNMFELLDENGALVILSCGNLLGYKSLYEALCTEIESFRIISSYHIKSNNPFPSCTIIAPRKSELNDFQNRYVQQALKDKNICNSKDTRIESTTITRSSCSNSKLPTISNVSGNRR